MNARRAGLVAALLLAALPGAAQERGFAGLGGDNAGYALPDPARGLSFPRDHGAHEDFRIEWWYLTANLRGEDGRDYGVQWTLFRSALAPEGPLQGWAAPQAWMAHAAASSPDGHHFAERFGRGSIGQAGVTAAPFAAWIDDWQMAAPEGAAGIDRLRVTARGGDFGYDLSATATGPLVAHGQNGFSVKSTSGQASHYYSQPFYDIEGTLALPGGEVKVAGQAWLDREWSSQPLDRSQRGWDWIALHLDDGRKLMAAQVRGDAPFLFGSLIAPDGTVQPLRQGDLMLDAGRGSPPTRWQVRVPGAGIDVTIDAVNPDSSMATSVPYWEGPVTVEGSSKGRGYLEMTGYPAR